jgi:hypothetical protein
MTHEAGAAADWYPDPLGRYENRYFNGREWTSDVSVGGERFVDPWGVTPGPMREAGRTGTGLATASMVIGIIAIAISWMPFVVVLGVVAAIVALVLGTVALRRARHSGSGRSFAVVGLATGATALVAAVVGVILSVVVVDAYDAYLNPRPHEVTLLADTCKLVGNRAEVTGELTNTGDRTADYSVLVGFVRPGTDNANRSRRVAVRDVEPGGTHTFEVQIPVDLDAVDCIVLQVNGPLPFGVAVD